MCQPLISVIIPFYNRAYTLSTCVDSVVNADYKNIEIILIDDGSSDGSGEIAKIYSQKYPNVKYLYQQNGGVSTARNKGLENANGEWITFIDSDDIVKPNHFNIVVNEGKEADLLMTGSTVSTITDSSKINCYSGIRISQDVAHKYLLGDKFNPFENVFYSVWDKFFRKEIIDVHNLRFDKSMSLGEDQVFVCEYMARAGRLVRYTNLTYISLSWDIPMVRLGRKTRSPEDYLHNEIKGYDALMTLSKATGNRYAEKYAVNFGFSRPISNILYAFSKKENHGFVEKKELIAFLSDNVIPFLKSIDTSNYKAQELNIRISSFILKNFRVKIALSWSKLWVNNLQNPMNRIYKLLTIPRNYIRYKRSLRNIDSQIL